MVYRLPEDEEGVPVEDGAVPPPPPAPPGAGGAATPVTAEGGGGGGGGGGGRGRGGPPERPTFNFPGLPGFVAPTYLAPTMEQAMAEPGYAMRLQAGQDALQRSAAARGLLRTGGTLRDLVEYGQKFGQQEYGNVYNRSLQEYDRRYQSAKDAFAPKLLQYQTLANAELQAGLAAFNRRGGGGGGGGGMSLPPLDVILGPPPMPPDYAQMYTAPSGPAAQAGVMGPGTAYEDEQQLYY